ncbi:uncharacterized protein cubi_00728 [Cryptosporidium ubiquitum]|uniref:Uncharacterized protein n=1 Tax=Cryptosporidium ubiquitum TaxID=857276 RepID=A0A1J4MCF9_9CRYT|nr:uncharacterized protein cubi_00728 [Cryptosporidium ubiquitum]OII71920.1 hypothetical protein cubi_00728 [Cryptosporidium ubiquitum]
MENSESSVKGNFFENQEMDTEIQLDKESLQVILEEGENFYPLLESSIEDEMAGSKVSPCSFMDKFKQFHESKVKSMNLEQIEDYCKEFVEALQNGK